MRVTTLLATAATAGLLALAAAAPALADGRADTLTSETSRFGQVDEDFVLGELRPAVVGVHQGISGGFVEVPPPNVQMPDVPAPRMPALPVG
ncbi:hypothetical protein ACIRL2_14435 [Embleya sp. NPDC127516]|uniref:hypothetical protein n=1 Tax=Embleya sp. NPDC127516 TaxID=3363990 RepID=UPI00380BF810